MTLQPHDTDVKALTRLAGVENIVFCCNRATADHVITSPLFTSPDYKPKKRDYTNYTNRFKGQQIVDDAMDNFKKAEAKNSDK